MCATPSHSGVGLSRFRRLRVPRRARSDIYQLVWHFDCHTGLSQPARERDWRMAGGPKNITSRVAGWTAPMRVTRYSQSVPLQDPR